MGGISERPPGSQEDVHAAATTVAASVPDDCPAALTEDLESRNARVVWQRREGPRMYMRAQSPRAEYFAWYTLSRQEGAMVAREALIRSYVGVSGVLRAPPLLAHGDNWRIEPFIHSEPLRGEQAITIAVSAAAAIADLVSPGK